MGECGATRRARAQRRMFSRVRGGVAGSESACGDPRVLLGNEARALSA